MRENSSSASALIGQKRDVGVSRAGTLYRLVRQADISHEIAKAELARDEGARKDR
jgi:hypothetical protein